MTLAITITTHVRMHTKDNAEQLWIPMARELDDIIKDHALGSI